MRGEGPVVDEPGVEVVGEGVAVEARGVGVGDGVPELQQDDVEVDVEGGGEDGGEDEEARGGDGRR